MRRHGISRQPTGSALAALDNSVAGAYGVSHADGRARVPVDGLTRAPPHTPMNSTNAPTAGRREWIGLAVLALPCVLYSMDLTVLNLAVPHLSAELHPSSAQLLWIVDIYGFLLAGSLITMGTFGDRIGRRRLLMGGAAAFGMASIITAFSNSGRCSSRLARFWAFLRRHWHPRRCPSFGTCSRTRDSAPSPSRYGS